MKNINKKIIFLFAIIYFSGFWSATEYGISWDENTHRIFGQKTLVYISKYFGIDHLFDIPEGLDTFGVGGWAIKDYSSLFDSFSGVVEELFSIQDMRNIFLFRHILNWTIYFIGYIAFFYLLNEIIITKHIIFICVVKFMRNSCCIYPSSR